MIEGRALLRFLRQNALVAGARCDGGVTLRLQWQPSSARTLLIVAARHGDDDGNFGVDECVERYTFGLEGEAEALTADLAAVIEPIRPLETASTPRRQG